VPATPKLLSAEECHRLDIAEVQDLYRRYVNPGQVDIFRMFTSGRELAERAEGAWIQTRSGRRVLDFTGGLGVLSHGHNHPRVLEVRRRYAAERRMEVHKLFLSPYIAGLSHNVAQLLPGDLEISFFPNSGAEAVEGAVKMAYKYHRGRRRFILHSDLSFHGKLLVSGSLSESPEVHFRFQKLPNAVPFEFDSLASVRALLEGLRRPDGSSDVYAVIVEPMSASTLRTCSAEFLGELRRLCSQEDVVLIFDEVYTGWAKCGELFYFMRHHVVPDLLTFGKAFGGGKATIAGYVARPPIFQRAYGSMADALLHTSTFNGFGEECATALEAVNIIVEDDYVGRARRIHQRLRPGLEALRQRHPEAIEEVRGAGALCGILLNAGPRLLRELLGRLPIPLLGDATFLQKLAASAVMEHLYAHYDVLTVFCVNREVPLLCSPPLIVNDEEIDLFLDALDRTLDQGLMKLTWEFARNYFR
jgi:putrescine aminotransferase